MALYHSVVAIYMRFSEQAEVTFDRYALCVVHSRESACMFDSGLLGQSCQKAGRWPPLGFSPQLLLSHDDARLRV